MSPELLPVRLRGVPLATLSDVDIYISDVIRELQLIEVGRDQGIAAPDRISRLAADLLPLLRWARDLVVHAVIDGDDDSDVTDLTLQVPADSVAAVTRVSDLVVELGQLARQGALFTVPNPEVLRLVEWLATEGVNQLRGGPADPGPPDLA